MATCPCLFSAPGSLAQYAAGRMRPGHSNCSMVIGNDLMRRPVAW
jgi:hypothetical protein